MIFHLHDKLALDIHDTLVKIGFDYGGECLKIAVLIMAKDQIGLITEAGTSVKMIKKMKLNSVKRVIILAAADVKEHRENVKILWQKTNLNSIKMHLAIDLKMANIVLGIQSHSSTHSCYICNSANPFKPGVDWEKVDGEKVKLRTLGSIRENVTAWRNAGADLKSAKNYNNCTEMPLFEEKDDDGKYLDSDVLTMHIIPPGELHLFLGLNHIYNELKKIWPEAEKWAAQCHVFVEGRYQQFNGNGCNSLLRDKSLTILESMLPKDEHLLGFARALRALSKVVSSCFGYAASPSVKDDIEQFRKLYLKLNITVTPKMHIIFEHVFPYLQHKAALSEDKWTGLAVETEQPFEASHHQFNKRWDLFKVNRDNKGYKNSFHRAVTCHNSLNVEVP